jgi:hypothetical protein
LSCEAVPEQAPKSQEDVAKEIETLGGKVFWVDELPGRPPYIAHFRGSRFTDKNIVRYLAALPTLTQVRLLDTNVTCKGLKALRGLTSLRALVIATRKGSKKMTKDEFELFKSMKKLTSLVIIGYAVPTDLAAELKRKNALLMLVIIDRCAAKATFVLGDQGQVGFRQEGS